MEQNQTQIFGLRAVIEAVNAQETIDKVYLQKGQKGELFSELESLLNENSHNNYYVQLKNSTDFKTSLKKYTRISFL